MTHLMDDLAKDIHSYLLEVSTDFEGNHLVLIPITEVVKKFGRTWNPERKTTTENPGIDKSF